MKKRSSFAQQVGFKKRFWRSRYYYLMLLPALVYVLIFNYAPMAGLQVAFRDYKMSLGVWGSKWIGLRNFVDFFNSYSFPQLMKNTFILSLYHLLVGFPIPILVALILNELRPRYKKFSQTILYAPHFISLVVLIGMMKNMLSPSSGAVNRILGIFGVEPIYFMGESGMFRHLYVWSGVWQSMGWGAIIYLAALSGVDPALHEAAEIDGATRLQRVLYINIPTILPTIIIMLIMQLGRIATVGYEKVYLMQNDMNVATSEVISTYVYKRGIINSSYGFSTAVGIFNNVINVTMLLIANKVSSKVSETSLF